MNSFYVFMSHTQYTDNNELEPQRDKNEVETTMCIIQIL